jgi:hypothetical protein
MTTHQKKLIADLRVEITAVKRRLRPLYRKLDRTRFEDKEYGAVMRKITAEEKFFDALERYAPVCFP